MSAQVLQFHSCLEHFECWDESCGMAFGMPREFARVARVKGTVFHCPRGHRLRFGESEVEQLKKQLTEERARVQREQARTESAKRSARAYRGQVTRVRNRVGNGVCPCCNRTFQNLMRHMETQHPEFKEAECENESAD
jgi:hypothetical protein